MQPFELSLLVLHVEVRTYSVHTLNKVFLLVENGGLSIRLCTITTILVNNIILMMMMIGSDVRFNYPVSK